MLLLIAAVPQEFSGLRGVAREVSRHVRWQARANMPGGEALLVANGLGRAAASSGARSVLAQYPARAIVSTGFAGGLVPGLRAGDIFVAEAVRGAAGEFAALQPEGCPPTARRGILLTVDRVVQSAQAKMRLAAQGAQAVDMEAAGVAAVAVEKSLPFFCVRAISDGVGRDLPVDFNRAIRPNGTISVPRVLAAGARSPGRWLQLAGLARDVRMAAKALAACLTRCHFHP